MTALGPGVKALTLPDPESEPQYYGVEVDVLTRPELGPYYGNKGLGFDIVCGVRLPDGRTHSSLGEEFGYRARYLLPLPGDEQKKQFQCEAIIETLRPVEA